MVSKMAAANLYFKANGELCKDIVSRNQMLFKQ